MSDNEQLERIERKLDEVLKFRDELQMLMATFLGSKNAKFLSLVAKSRGAK